MNLNLLKAFPLLFVFALVGCEQEGPMESAGEEIDQTAEDVGESFEENTEDLRDQ